MKFSIRGLFIPLVFRQRKLYKHGWDFIFEVVRCLDEFWETMEIEDLETEEKLRRLFHNWESPAYVNEERRIGLGTGLEGTGTLTSAERLGRAILDRSRAWHSLLDDFVYSDGHNHGWDLADFDGVSYYVGGPEETMTTVVVDDKLLDRAVRTGSYHDLPAIAVDMRLTSPYIEKSHRQRPLLVVPQRLLFPVDSKKAKARGQELMGMINAWANYQGTRIWQNQEITAREFRDEIVPVHFYLLRRNVEEPEHGKMS